LALKADIVEALELFKKKTPWYKKTVGFIILYILFFTFLEFLPKSFFIAGSISADSINIINLFVYPTIEDFSAPYGLNYSKIEINFLILLLLICISVSFDSYQESKKLDGFFYAIIIFIWQSHRFGTGHETNMPFELYFFLYGLLYLGYALLKNKSRIEKIIWFAPPVITLLFLLIAVLIGQGIDQFFVGLHGN